MTARPIRVAFLLFYFEAWDSLAEVYERMANDPRFSVLVITLPRRLTGDTEFRDEAKVHEFLESRGVPHLRFDYSGRGEEGLTKLQNLAPDYVFINYPWQRNYQPAYRVDNLVQFTRVCYVPYYSLPLTNEPGELGVAPHLYTQRSHQLASFVFTQDAAIVEAYAATDRGNEYVIHVGSPKLDALARTAAEGAEWPIAGSGENYRIVWAPHHSYGPNWLNFGVFAQVCDQFLALATNNPELDFVLRPHPFLFGTLVDREVMSQTNLDEWLRGWNDLPNTAIDTTGSYARLFEATDLLITDGISFLGEYPLVTGKPGVFLEKPDHWQFSPLGELAAEANIRVAAGTPIASVLAAAMKTGLPPRDAQIAALREAASPHPGQSAKLIVETIAGDFAAGPSRLVNPADIKTVAWEHRPGAEPQVD